MLVAGKSETAQTYKHSLLKILELDKILFSLS
jgi:hypothetical protein